MGILVRGRGRRYNWRKGLGTNRRTNLGCPLVARRRTSGGGGVGLRVAG